MALAKLATAVPKERVWETLAHWGERSIAIQCSHGLNCHGCVLGHPVSTFLDEVVKLDEDLSSAGIRRINVPVSLLCICVFSRSCYKIMILTGNNTLLASFVRLRERIFSNCLPIHRQNSV